MIRGAKFPFSSNRLLFFQPSTQPAAPQKMRGGGASAFRYWRSSADDRSLWPTLLARLDQVLIFSVRRIAKGSGFIMVKGGSPASGTFS